MTNESISGFLNSIAEAKRAFDAEPTYQSRIQDLEQRLQTQSQTIADREIRIHNLKQFETELTAKLRSVEPERDDAGFRALEEADKVQNLLNVVHSVINDTLKVVSAVEGKESIVLEKTHYDALSKDRDVQSFRVSELEAELRGLKDEMHQAQEQLTRPFNPEGGDTSSSVEGGTDPSSKREWNEDGWGHPVVQEQTSFNHVPEGQSEVDPTVSTIETAPSASVPSVVSLDTAPIPTSEGQSDGPFAIPQSKESETVSSTIADTSTSAPSSASPPERNRDRATFFKNRKYFDVTYFVPLHQWLEDGGAYDDYYWRPADANVALPQPNRASHNS